MDSKVQLGVVELVVELQSVALEVVELVVELQSVVLEVVELVVELQSVALLAAEAQQPAILLRVVVLPCSGQCLCSLVVVLPGGYSTHWGLTHGVTQ